MNALKKQLKKRGIIFNTDEKYCLKGAEYDNCASYVGICKTNFGNLIITKFDSAVIDPIFRIYNTDFKLIGEQNVFPEFDFVTFESKKTSRTWCSYCF